MHGNELQVSREYAVFAQFLCSQLGGGFVTHELMPPKDH